MELADLQEGQSYTVTYRGDVFNDCRFERFCLIPGRGEKWPAFNSALSTPDPLLFNPEHIEVITTE